ncbi:PilN domain-containing protein [Methylorubrum salsuginis]|uniref:General secretion pathway protein L n=1 Tax=Methylorubrum salsuginis TaxID=414703 RepID=A0A1I4ABZ3_9HYPH|nr:PilN domain-containing protein [Methylorubrum salsuginis]SFK53952.1 general secretion pathway protein L [Methylorubrum salsuginis]
MTASIRMAGFSAQAAALKRRLGGSPLVAQAGGAVSLLLDAFVAAIEPRLGRFLDRSRRIAVVEGDGLALYEVRDGRVSARGLFDGAAPQNFAGRGLELRLPPHVFLARTLRLPDAGRDYLGPILSHRLERLTPWRPDRVLYGYDVPEPAGPDGTIAVDLLATSSDLVAPHLDALNAAGLKVTALGSAAAPLDTPLAIDLYRGRPGASGGSPLRRPVALAAALAFGLLVPACLAAALLAASAEAEQAEAGAHLAALRSRLAARSGTGGTREAALLAAKQPDSSILVLIDRLSTALPDGTVLRELDADATKVRLVGRSDDAAALIGLLEGQGGLSAVRFAAPVIRDAERREAFDIVASRVPGTVPGQRAEAGR